MLPAQDTPLTWKGMNGGDGIVPSLETENLSLPTEKGAGKEASGSVSAFDEILSALIMSIIAIF